MQRYDQLYRLYDQFDPATLRALQEFVDLFPPVDARPALAYWDSAREELTARRGTISDAFAEEGAVMADIAGYASRDAAFTALDLLETYGRGVDVLVLDVDETLRSAGGTDNEIPRETLHLLTEFVEAGVPLVICTGQTLENVKGFLIQGLGSELVHAGDVSIVYEAGTGVFTPGNGPATKALLYEDLDADIRAVFDRVRARILSSAPAGVRAGCHLQGNEFNVTLKPNFQTGSDRARSVVESALVHELDLLDAAVRAVVDPEGGADGGTTEGTEEGRDDPSAVGDSTAAADHDGARGDRADATGDDSTQVGGEWARAFYAAQDPEIAGVLDATEAVSTATVESIPSTVRSVFERIDVAYYEADAAEIGSRELNKVVGVERAFDALGVEDPFALVMGDSKSDLRVMRWVAERDAGIASAPEHASADVLDHVHARDDLVFARGDAAAPLRMAYALNRLATLE